TPHTPPFPYTTLFRSPDKRRPKQQPTRNEGDRDKYKVGVIGEKLHVGTAGMGVWRKRKVVKKSGQSSHYKITVLRDGLGRSAERSEEHTSELQSRSDL